MIVIFDTTRRCKVKHIVTIIIFLVLTCSNVFANINTDIAEDALYELNNTSNKIEKLADKVESLKDKHYLEYKDRQDLLETIQYIVYYTKDSNFNEYDLLAIAIRESKLNRMAYNRTDGGKGLFQITNPRVWWAKELYWFDKPFSKAQSTKAAITILETYYGRYGSKTQAIQHYNSGNKKGIIYEKGISKLRAELVRQK